MSKHIICVKVYGMRGIFIGSDAFSCAKTTLACHFDLSSRLNEVCFSEAYIFDGCSEAKVRIDKIETVSYFYPGIYVFTILSRRISHMN